MDFFNLARSSRDLPQAIAADGQEVALRLSRYGDQYASLLNAKNHTIADEGGYFVATNPTPGTGIATIAAQATLADTSPFIVITNTNPPSAGGGKRLYLDYLKLIVTAAGTNGTSIRFATKIDARSTPYTSGGSSILPVNVNMDSERSSAAQIYAGALVSPAASRARLVSNLLLRTVIPVVGDQYLINFGGQDIAPNSLAVAGTAIANVVWGHPPVVIGPGQNAFLHIWLPSQSAASSYEFELGYWER